MKKILTVSLLWILFSIAYNGVAQNITGSAANDLVPGSEQIRLSQQSTVPLHVIYRSGYEPVFSSPEQFLRASFGLNASFGLIQLSVDNDRLGFTHYRYQQAHNQLPVIGSMYILHVKNNKIVSMNGVLIDNIKTPAHTAISENEALNNALKHVNASVYKWQLPSEESWLRMEQDNAVAATYYPNGALCYAAGKTNAELHLAYQFDIYAQQPLSRKYIYVDAATGRVIDEKDRIHEANTPGTAVTGYAGTQPIITDSNAGSYRLREAGRGAGLGMETYNLQKGTNYGAAVDFTDTDNNWNNVNANKDQYATDAHFATEKTYDYFYNTYGRNSINNAGLKLLSYVHYSTNYVNAFWDGTRMTYGDGNATYNPLTSMDIGGHEITHGLTEYTANLNYSYESGALNESFSDIFGTTIENYATPALFDWLIGEDIGAAFRSHSNPNAYGDPDTYLGTNWYTGTGDNGGVHTNSGVQNFWYYLLSVGGSGTNDIGNAYSVTGIGITKAAAIAFRSLTVYLSSTSQYADARYYSIQAATDLYGACSPEVQATTNAWYAVGVGSVFTPGVTAAFSANVTSGCSVPFTVQFTNTSSNASNASWDFGDGGTSIAYNPSYTYTTPGTYSVTLIASGACGSNSTTRTSYIIIGTPSAPVTTGASRCSTGSVVLSASGSGTLNWYSQSSGGVSINTGTSYTTPSLVSTTTYYVENQVAQPNGNVGPANNNFGTGGLHNNSTPQYLIFDVLQPCTLVSVFVNSGAAGTRNVVLWNSQGTVLQTVPVNFPSGNATITLNMALSPGTGYRLGGASMNLYRNNSGAAHPYSLNGLINITGASAGSAFYYYYYNWLIQPQPCISARTPVTATINPLPTVTANNVSGCEGTSIALSGTPAGGTWSVANPYTGPTTSYTHTYTDGNGCTSTSPAATITVNPLPAVTADNVSGCEGTSIALSGTPAGGTWSVANPYTGPTTSYTHTYTDGNGCTSTSPAATITVNPLPAVTADNVSGCEGTSIVLSGTPAGGTWSVANPYTGPSTTYTHTYTDGNGCTNTSSAASITVNPLPTVTANNVSGCEGTSIALSGTPAGGTWSVANPYTGPSTFYTHTYTDGNGCTNTSAPANITVNPLPAVSFSGLAASYNVNDAPAALTGNPAGGTFSGTGISGNTFNPSSAGVGGPYTITYTYTDGNGCTNSSAQQTAVNNCVPPATPGTITQTGGAAKVCPNETRTYTVSPVAQATSYNWTVPTGMNILSGQTSNSIVVLFDAALANSSTIMVNASNACGISGFRSKTISKNVPATPSAITGSTFGVCNSSNQPYSVTNVSGITYNWSFDVGNASVISGQGSNSIAAAFGSTYTTGKLTVIAGNLCGASNPRTITVKSTPATPASLTGPTSVCIAQQGVPYSTVAVPTAITYTWTGPSGSRISDGVVTSTTSTLTTTSTSVTVNYGNNAGTLRVKANNPCGSGSNKQITITFSCRSSSEGVSNINLEVYPNPAKDLINVSFNAERELTYYMELLDVIGKTLYTKSINTVEGMNRYEMDLSNFTKGVYVLVIKRNDFSQTTKVILQ